MALVLAVDIGNTNTHIGMVETETFTCINHVSLSSQGNVQDMVHAINALADAYGPSEDIPITLCSVIKPLEKKLAATLNRQTKKPIRCVHFHDTLPIRIRYDKPDTLGADRIANTLYAAARFPDEACIIIDAGTAINIEMVSASGEFTGGFIMPGMVLQLESMHQRTAALPLVKHGSIDPPFPPQSTTSGMHTGVLWSIAGGISYIIKKVIEKNGTQSNILACGGAWKTIAALVDFSYEYIPALTLIGVGLYEE